MSNEEKLNENNTDTLSPICMCGDAMSKLEISAFTDSHWCDICGFKITSLNKKEFAYTCPRGTELPHLSGYDYCIECAKQLQPLNINNEPIKELYSIKRLYFIYNNNKISGPYDIDELIMLYIKRKIKTNILYIKSAESENKNNKWYKLQFAKNIYSDKKDIDKIRFNTISECLLKNQEIKKKFPL